MKNKKLFIMILFAFIGLNNISNAQAPNWQWAKSANGASYSIATDSNGNSYVTGSFNSSTITIGSFTLTNSSAGNHNDLFIAKYDALGNVIWAKSAGGSNDDVAESIAVDANGNTYITGYFISSSITFGTTTLNNAGIENIFVAKYDLSGNAIWAKSAGGTQFDEGKSICVDAIGNTYLTGIFMSASITFGTTILSNSGSGFDNIFVVKFDASGNTIWEKSAGGANEDISNCICVDIYGNLYITGSFNSSTITFGSTTLSNSGFADVFVVKYGNTGNVIWAKKAGSSSIEFGYGISTDNQGNAFIVGEFSGGTINFGGNTLTNTTINYSDIFLVKYDSSGIVSWAKSAGGTDFDYCKSVTLDPSGNAFVSGYFKSSSMNFGNTTLTNSNNGSAHIFVSKYDNSGNQIWAKDASGIGYGNSLRSDFMGDLLVTGTYSGSSIDFDGTVLTGSGFFVAKLNGTTGIEVESNSLHTINISPNPSNGQLNISSSNIIDEIEILNTIGQIIYHSKPKEKNVMMQFDNEGIYFVKLSDGEKQYTQKLIIQ